MTITVAAPSTCLWSSRFATSAVTSVCTPGNVIGKTSEQPYASVLAFASGAFCMCAGIADDAPNAMTHTAPDAQTQVIVTATRAFLDSLSADQRVQVQLTFTPQQTATAAHFTGGPTIVPPLSGNSMAKQFGRTSQSATCPVRV